MVIVQWMSDEKKMARNIIATGQVKKQYSNWTNEERQKTRSEYSDGQKQWPDRKSLIAGIEDCFHTYYTTQHQMMIQVVSERCVIMLIIITALGSIYVAGM